MPKCFWYDECTTGTLLNATDRQGALMVFLENIISWAYFWGFWLNNIFHWWAHLEIRSKSIFSWSVKCLISWTVENIEVSSGKSFTDDQSLHKSFIKIRKSKGPNVDPSGTPANTGSHEEVWPFNFEVVSETCYLCKNISSCK